MERRFIYRANAVAAGGQLFAPAPAPIPLQAPLVLPVSGGSAAAETRGFRLGHVVSFDRASTRVAGGLLPGTQGWGTVSEVSLEGLSLLEGRVTVARLLGRLASLHPYESGGPEEGRISTAGTRIEGLCIDGKAVEFTDHAGTFAKLSTCASVHQAFANRAFHETFMNDFFWGGEVSPDAPETLRALAESCRQHTRKATVPVIRGLIPCSVVGTVRLARDPRLRAWGNWIGVPGVGRLQLGELLIGPSYRRLTLLRVELDTAYVPPPLTAPAARAGRAAKKDDEPAAPDTGEMSFGGVETDGTPHP